MADQEKIKNLCRIPGIGDKIAQLLIHSGFDSVDKLNIELNQDNFDAKEFQRTLQKNNLGSCPSIDSIMKWRESIRNKEHLYTIAKIRYNDLRDRTFMQIYYFFLYSKLNKYNWRFKEDKEIQEKVYRLSLKEDFFNFTTRFNTEKVFRLELLEKFLNDYKKMQDVKLRNWYIGKMDKIKYPNINYKEIVSNMKTKFLEVFKDQTSFEEFKKIYHKDDDKIKRRCYYCGINEAQIEILVNELKIKTKRFYARGKTMEIDQKKPENGYKKCNIVLACYWCNNAKTDEFDEVEFKKIGEVIGGIWLERLKS